MFSKIYVPIDNSDISEKVLQEAIDFVRGTDKKLRVAHVVNLEQITFGIEMVGVAELKETLLSIANRLLDHVKETLNKNSVAAEVVLIENYGSDLSSLVIEDAQKWGADLFILGSHHLGSFSHFVTGGLAEDLTHETEIPILLITRHKQD